MTKSIQGGLFGLKRLTGCALAAALLFAGMSALAAGPVARIGETEYDTLVGAFAAVKDGEVIQMLANETFSTCGAQNKTFTIKGNGTNEDECVTITLPGTTAMAGCNVTFQNLIIDKNPKTTYQGFHHISSEIYQNCLIKGELWTYGSTAKFQDCGFVQTDDRYYSVYVYGSTDVVFDGCRFDVNGRTIKVSKDQSSTVSVAVENCEFNTQKALKPVVMVDVHANRTRLIMDTESNVLGETFFETNEDGSFKVEGGKPYYFSEEHAWNTKNNMPDGTSEEVWMEQAGEDRRGYVAVGQDIELDENGDVIGGEFTYIVSEIVNESLMPEKGSEIDEKTGTPILVLVTKEAQIGKTGYKTLAEALAAVQDNDILKLTSDVSTNGTITLPGKTFTIDTNGRKLSFTDGAKLELSDATQLTIDGNGSIIGEIEIGGGSCEIRAGRFSVRPEDALVAPGSVIVDTGDGDCPYVVVVREETYARVMSFVRTGTDVTLGWGAVAGLYYQVEWTDTLGETADWTPYGEPSATSPVVTLPDQTASSRFYRVRSIEVK